jgi:hypothetical protein
MSLLTLLIAFPISIFFGLWAGYEYGNNIIINKYKNNPIKRIYSTFIAYFIYPLFIGLNYISTNNMDLLICLPLFAVAYVFGSIFCFICNLEVK